MRKACAAEKNTDGWEVPISKSEPLISFLAPLEVGNATAHSNIATMRP